MIFKQCKDLSGKCSYTLDAFYVLAVFFSLFGALWLLVFNRFIRRLETYSKSAWKVSLIFK